MANSLTASPFPAHDHEAVAAASRFLLRNQGSFALLLAEYPAAFVRDTSIQAIREQTAGAHTIHAFPSATAQPLAALRQTLSLSPADYLHLLSLDAILGRHPEMLRQLNVQRAEWKALECPVIFWLDRDTMGRFLREAPDFADWRSATLFFRESSGPQQQEERLATFLFDGDLDRLLSDPPDVRRQRIEELRSRLLPEDSPDANPEITSGITADWCADLITYLVLENKVEEAMPLLECLMRYDGGSLEKQGERCFQMFAAFAVTGGERETIELGEKILRRLEAGMMTPKSKWLRVKIHQVLAHIFLNSGSGDDFDAAFEQTELGAELLEEATGPEMMLAKAVAFSELARLCLQRGDPGDANRARKLFEKVSRIREELGDQIPQTSISHRNFSIATDHLADFYLQEGEAERALELFQTSLKITQQLLANNPNSHQAKRDHSVSLGRVAGCYLKRGEPGDSGKALELFQQANELHQGILADNPASSQARRDLSVSLGQLAGVYLLRGQHGDAEHAFSLSKKELEVTQQILVDNPNSPQAKRDVAVALERLSDCASQAERLEEALSLQRQAVVLVHDLWNANPSYYHHRTYIISLWRSGILASRSGQADEAGQAFAKAHQLLLQLQDSGTELDPELSSMLAKLNEMARS